MKLLGLIPLLVLLGSSCAPATAEGGPRYRTDRIVREQLVETRQPDLYTAIQRLQPGWLQARGPVYYTIGVFVDGGRAGDVEMLKNIPSTQVSEVRYVGPRSLHSELLGQQAAGLYAAIMVSSLRM